MTWVKVKIAIRKEYRAQKRRLIIIVKKKEFNDSIKFRSTKEKNNNRIQKKEYVSV